MSGKTGVKVAFSMALTLLTLVPYMASGHLSSQSTSYLMRESFLVRTVTDQSSYLRGEIVKIEIYVTNNEKEAVKFPFNTGYEVFDSNGRQIIGLSMDILWAADHLPTLPPQSETLVWTFWWTQKSLLPMRQVRVGVYTIKTFIESSFGYLSSETVIRIYPNIDAFPRVTGKFIFY